MTPLQAIRAIAALAPKEGDLPEWAKIAQKVSKDHEGLPYFPGEPDWFDEESAIAELLFSDILFANSRRYLCIDGSEQPETIVLFVLCNDLFGGGADAEQITREEIRPLYEAYINSKPYLSNEKHPAHIPSILAPHLLGNDYPTLGYRIPALPLGVAPGSPPHPSCLGDWSSNPASRGDHPTQNLPEVTS